MSLINLKLDGGTVESTSATQAVIASAKLVFGVKGEAIVKRMEEMVKVKELDTSKIDYILDQIKTSTDDELRKWKATASGKATITSARALVSAKSLVQVINALRGIKVPRVATKTGVKGTAGVVAKTRTPTKPVVAQRTDTQKALPKVNLRSITPKFMNTVSQAQIDSIAAQLSEATGLTFAGQPVQNANGQSSPWNFIALNPNARYVSVNIDPPFHFNEYSSSSAWGVSAQTKGGKFAFGNQLRKPTVQALAKEVRAVVGTASKVAKAVKKLDMPKTYKITELRRMTHTQRVAFTKKLNLVLGLDNLVYGISNNGESFKSEPGEEWEMQGHLGGSDVFITFDGPYDNEQTGKWSVSMNDLDDGEQESFTANDFDGMRSFIHNNKK
ncbi:hypothetical protein pEaSNUABM5_00180 [Erwinia phage pEa_SNUABM_5]|uniref:Uncharacterized protein n=1 Tax=Erwinia phage pEa_SNUABM_5 TaxID=2797313 RepID=A0A7T8EPJ7_9CAUD|nr:hypothetical protein MPK73_gp180 [Erwinia phage pEa_SNUABM_5]QQO90322.1 hypothetical protein pEaSNUABM5_00180 [Erwinia phage pEa_SNUABM_5]